MNMCCFTKSPIFKTTFLSYEKMHTPTTCITYYNVKFVQFHACSNAHAIYLQYGGGNELGDSKSNRFTDCLDLWGTYMPTAKAAGSVHVLLQYKTRQPEVVKHVK